MTGQCAVCLVSSKLPFVQKFGWQLRIGSHNPGITLEKAPRILTIYLDMKQEALRDYFLQNAKQAVPHEPASLMCEVGRTVGDEIPA